MGFSPSDCVRNPGHHDPSQKDKFRGGGSKTEIIPNNAEELYKKAIPGFDATSTNQDIPKKLYSIDKEGTIHQFFVDNRGMAHWAGSEKGARGVHIDNTTKKRLLEFYNDMIK